MVRAGRRSRVMKVKLGLAGLKRLRGRSFLWRRANPLFLYPLPPLPSPPPLQSLRLSLPPSVDGASCASPVSTTDEDQASPLLDLLGMLPDLFEKEVLKRLDPADRGFFAQVSHGCRAAVVASDLQCAGTRVGLRRLNRADRARLAEAVRSFLTHPELPGTMDFYLGALGYVEESSVVPRAGGVVRLELKHFCTSAERLAWARARGCRWDESTCALAAQGGHLELLRWARKHGCPWGERTCRYAAQGGHLELLNWAREHGCPWEEMLMCFYAAECGHLEVLKWLRELGCHWGSTSCRAAARGGHLELLQWMREHDCPWDRDGARRWANIGGQQEVLRWLKTQHRD